MSNLADAIYDILRARLAIHQDARISYAQLAGELQPPHAGMPPRDARIAEALGELVHRCRQHELPVISALVVRQANGNLTDPSAGYYDTAHPDADDGLEAWLEELKAVQTRKEEFPSRL